MILETLFLCGSGWFGAGEPAVPRRAIWMWAERSAVVIADPVARDEALAFLVSKGIEVVYLEPGTGRHGVALRDDGARVATLLEAFHARGVEVHAVLGSATGHTHEWVLERRRAEALRALEDVLDYDRSVASTARFDGVHLDVEPWRLRTWESDQPNLLRRYLVLVDALQGWIRARNVHLPLSLAIPFWFDSVGAIEWQGVLKPMNEHVQDLADAVVVMDYRDRACGPDGIVGHVESELRYGEAIGKPVVIGVEVQPTTTDKVSFHEEGEEVLECELRTVAAAVGASPAFGGFAIHHFDAYLDWKLP